MDIINKIILLLSFCFISACSNFNEITVERHGKPALWKVSTKLSDTNNDKQTNNASLYLFGTIHLLPKGAEWRTSTIDSAIKDSDILITETTGLEDTANVSKIFNAMAMDEKTTNILERVRSADIDTLKYVIKDHGLSQKALNNMETWAATLAISNAYTSDLGLKRTLGVETILTKQFKEQNKPMEGLETIASQFAIFDNLSEKDQRHMLEEVINNGVDSRANFLKLLDAWLDGNSEALLDETDTGLLKSPAVKEALLNGRNRKWVNALINKLDNGTHKQYFVAVGAAHLIGKNGVPKLLQDAGYRVERIQ